MARDETRSERLHRLRYGTEQPAAPVAEPVEAPAPGEAELEDEQWDEEEEWDEAEWVDEDEEAEWEDEDEDDLEPAAAEADVTATDPTLPLIAAPPPAPARPPQVLVADLSPVLLPAPRADDETTDIPVVRDRPPRVVRAATPTPTPEPEEKQPFYPRLLRLKHLQLNAWQRALLADGPLLLSVVVVLADLASPWTILVLPLTVAAVVKSHDWLAGVLAHRAPETPTAPPPQGWRRSRGDS